MNKQKLINELKEKFFAVDEVGIHQGNTEAGITVWGIGVFNKVGDVVTKRNLTFYTKGDETAFWGVTEPNPPASEPVVTFTDRVNTFIATKINDLTIKFGYIEQISELTKKAWVCAITNDGIIKNAIVTEDVEGNFSIDIL